MNRQREVVPKRQGTRVKSSCTCVGLDPRDWQTIITVWSQWTGCKLCSKYSMEINRLFCMQGFVGQQIDLKQYSKPYWQPMKGTKQWKTASKTLSPGGPVNSEHVKPCEVNVSDTKQVNCNTPDKLFHSFLCLQVAEGIFIGRSVQHITLMWKASRNSDVIEICCQFWQIFNFLQWLNEIIFGHICSHFVWGWWICWSFLDYGLHGQAPGVSCVIPAWHIYGPTS